MWWIYAILSALGAAGTALLVKSSVASTSPLLATALRTAFVLPFVLIILWVNEKAAWPATGKAWLIVALSGATTALSWVFYTLAMQHGAVGPVSAVDKSSLALTFLLAFLFLGEVPTARQFVAIGLILAGSFLLIRGT